MTKNEILIFILGWVALYAAHVFKKYRMRYLQRRKNKTCFPEPVEKNMPGADNAVDWGYACNQLCLDLYGVDHPSAFLNKPVDFWRAEFMFIINRITPREAAQLLQKLEKEEAALSVLKRRSASAYAENTDMARQTIRRYLPPC